MTPSLLILILLAFIVLRLLLRAIHFIIMFTLFAVVSYFVYEKFILPTVCSGHCNMRTDLLFIWPLLGFLVLDCIVRTVLHLGRKSRQDE